MPDPDCDTATADGESGAEHSELVDDGGDEIDSDDDQPHVGRSRRRWLIGVTVGVALFVLGAMWTLASPVGSAPDDGFHLASIWCSPTAPGDVCIDRGNPFSDVRKLVEVPAEVGPGAHCYAFSRLDSAGCQEFIDRGSMVESFSNDGVYPSVFYWTMGLMVGDEPVNSVLLVRLFSWSLCMGLLAAGWAVLPERHRPAHLVMLLVTAIPLAVTLWPSTNPSGMVVAGVVAAWCAVVGLLHATGRRDRLIAFALFTIAVVAAAGSRADGGLYVFIAVLSGCALLARRLSGHRASVAAMAVVAVGGLVVSIVISLRRSFGGSFESALTPADSDGPIPTTGLVWANLLELPYFLLGNLGTAPLSWLDTPVPRSAWIPIAAAFFGLLFWGIGQLDRWKALSLAVVLVGLLAVPFALTIRGSHPVGVEVQPRYVLPLVPVLGFTALYWRHTTGIAALTRVQLGVVFTIAVVAHSLTLHAFMRRFITGVDVLSPNLDAGREWWWSIPITPNMVWALGSFAFAVVAAIVAWGLWCEREAGSADEPTYA